MITDQYLLKDQPHRVVGGRQRIYRFKDGHGLSAVNGRMLHSYPFAWEIAVLNGGRDDGAFEGLDYSTELTNDVEVFTTDDEADAFILKAASLFDNDAQETK